MTVLPLEVEQVGLGDDPDGLVVVVDDGERADACRTAASLTAHSRARREWAEPSIPTMIPGISFSLR